MSLSLTTHGMLWPQAAIFREQFQRIEVELRDRDVLRVSVSEMRELTTVIRVSPMTVRIKVTDSLTGEIAEESLKVKLDCS